jgi:hypothetical protein
VNNGSTLIGTRLCLIAEVKSFISVPYVDHLGQQRVTDFYSSVLKFTKEELKETNYFQQQQQKILVLTQQQKQINFFR